VNIPGRPFKAFAMFVTVVDSHAYSTGGQSLVLGGEGFSAPVAVEREMAIGFMRDTTLLDPPNSEAERRRLLGGILTCVCNDVSDWCGKGLSDGNSYSLTGQLETAG
jgi:hypothetical protein